MLASALAVRILKPVHQSSGQPHNHTRALISPGRTTGLLAIPTSVRLEPCSAGKLKIPAHRRTLFGMRSNIEMTFDSCSDVIYRLRLQRSLQLVE